MNSKNDHLLLNRQTDHEFCGSIKKNDVSQPLVTNGSIQVHINLIAEDQAGCRAKPVQKNQRYDIVMKSHTIVIMKHTKVNLIPVKIQMASFIAEH